MKEVIIYTDGACRGNPGLGGWGVLMQYHNENKELYGGEKSTTNNNITGSHDMPHNNWAVRAIEPYCAASPI